MPVELDEVHDAVNGLADREVSSSSIRRSGCSGASSGAGTAVILAATYPDIFATATSVAGGEYRLNRVDPDDPGSTQPVLVVGVP